MSNKSKVLVLGGSGQIGFGVASILNGLNDSIDLSVSVREKRLPWAIHMFSPARILRFDCRTQSLNTLELSKFDWVVNCIGLTKHARGGDNLKRLVELNTDFPKQLVGEVVKHEVGLIHISSDCVFRGDHSGLYTELSIPDALDNYGRTKAAAEEIYTNALVLRTSTMGIEMFNNGGLLNWIFLNRDRRVRGFSQAFFTGVTSRELGRVISRLVIRDPFSGLYNVAGYRFSKMEILKMINTEFDLNIDIKEERSFAIDRSLDGALFGATFGFNPKSICACLSDFSYRGQLC